jgi:hypothetical protein
MERDDSVEPQKSDPAGRRPRRSGTLIVFGIVGFLALAVGFDRLLLNASGNAQSSQATGSVPTSPVAGASPRSNLTEPPTPDPEPTLDATRVAPCVADDLAMAAGGWGGATGSMAGGATLINVTSEPCRIAGKPALELRAKSGVVIAGGFPASPGEPVVLRPGGVASVITVWGNWCDDPPARPLRLHLSLLDGAGTLAAEVHDWDMTTASVPRCDAPSEPSTIGAPLPFAAPELDSGGVANGPCAAGDLESFLGGWGAAAGTGYAPVVILNRSGETCSITTSPDLELRDADGMLLATGEPRLDGDSTLDLAAGTTAISSVGFANWCQAVPALPLRFDLLIGGEQVRIVPISVGSEFGLPFCNSAPQTPPPSLFWSDPFALPGS